MTLTERARQIDREEFAAECEAIRQRAYARLNMKPEPEKNVDEWITRPEPKRGIWREKAAPKSKTTTAKRAEDSKARLYTAFNSTRTLKGWAIETGLSPNTIRNRLNLGWSVEQAVALAPHKGVRPGVVSDLPAFQGTGVGRHAREFPEITFSSEG